MREGDPLIPDMVVSSFADAYPWASLEVQDLLRAAVGELASGSQQTKHLVTDFTGTRTTTGSAALVVGRKQGNHGTFCVSYQSFVLQDC